MVASTFDRVPRHRSHEINRQIQMQIAESVRWRAAHPEGIDRRLHELDRQWDIERTLKANASTLALTGVMLCGTVDKRGLALPALVTAFLLQHAVQGWCTPLPILRRLVFGTAREIETERYTLKVPRGDFGPTRRGAISTWTKWPSDAAGRT